MIGPERTARRYDIVIEHSGIVAPNEDVGYAESTIDVHGSATYLGRAEDLYDPAGALMEQVRIDYPDQTDLHSWYVEVRPNEPFVQGNSDARFPVRNGHIGPFSPDEIGALGVIGEALDQYTRPE